MSSHPINDWTVLQLHVLTADGTPDIRLAKIAGTGRAYSPSHHSIEFGWHHESPSRQQSGPGSDFHCRPVFLAINGVMHIPLELRSGMGGRCATYGVDVFVGMIAVLTVAPVAVPVVMVVAARPVVLMHGVCPAVPLGRLGRIGTRPVVSEHKPALLASGLVAVYDTLANCDV